MSCQILELGKKKDNDMFCLLRYKLDHQVEITPHAHTHIIILLGRAQSFKSLYDLCKADYFNCKKSKTAACKEPCEAVMLTSHQKTVGPPKLKVFDFVFFWEYKHV